MTYFEVVKVTTSRAGSRYDDEVTVTAGSNIEVNLIIENNCTNQINIDWMRIEPRCNRDNLHIDEKWSQTIHPSSLNLTIPRVVA